MKEWFNKIFCSSEKNGKFVHRDDTVERAIHTVDRQIGRAVTRLADR